MEGKMTDELGKTDIDAIAEDLISAAHRIHKYHITIALGQDPPKGFEKGQKDYQQRILDAVQPLIDKYEETKSIEAHSSKAVIDLLGKGKIKPSEAIALLKMLQTKMVVEEVEMELDIKKELIKEIDAEGEEETKDG